MKTVTHKGKGSKILPSRAALTELGRGQRTIQDYSKAVETQSHDPVPLVMQNLRGK